MYRILFVLALVVVLGLSGSAANLFDRAAAFEVSSRPLKSDAPTIRLHENLGDHHHPISTQSDLAQSYFDQGLTLAYGFNHAQAAGSFQQAAKLDPNCAMCYWGTAFVLGPNINAPMADDVVPEAWQALQRAIGLSENASAQEQAYIQALAQRYSSAPIADRHSLDVAYANAMRQVAQRYPDDLDAVTLFAEALMNTTPWNYWAANGDSKPETVEVLTALESVLERDPNHPGANHLYIHAVEASPDPDRGLASADRLRNLVPGAGHLVHMPSHIYLRVGQYHDASLANERAIAADQAYVTQSQAQGLYPALYFSHNMHFLWYAAMMEGRSARAINVAYRIAAHMSPEQVRAVPLLERFRPVPLFALARFGHWDDILAQPQPAADLAYETAIWRYARGLAFAAQGRLDAALSEAADLDQIANSEALQALDVDFFYAGTQLDIARKILAAEIAGQRGQTDDLIQHLEAAVKRQDDLPYMEPPYWYYPVRQSLGSALLQANRPEEAELVFRQDLEQAPDNGWSLFGLIQSLLAQGKVEEGQTVQAKFEDAWKYADAPLTPSRFLSLELNHLSSKTLTESRVQT
ncbi:MAG: hypothetical protein MJA27_11515 [Pseudanabaenales cyanobacterium]|nr:hypothetical protein [Pseudanabaenales cyanobacterium]